MSAREESFVHTYTEAGEYEAVFVAKNITFEGSNEVTVRLKVSIAEAAGDSGDDDKPATCFCKNMYG